MLVMLIGDRLISPEQVCQTCLMADQSGQPRWQRGRLRCGQSIQRQSERLPEQFECQMGFRVANID
jgi:hypothetical protein